MKKRLLAFLLVLVMVAGFVPVTALAEGTGTVTPYISNVFIGLNAQNGVNAEVTQYNTDNDNYIDIALPDLWGASPRINLTVSDGVDAGNLYCTLSHGASKETATTVFTTVRGIALNTAQNKILPNLQNLAKVGSVYWMKLVIGT